MNRKINQPKLASLTGEDKEQLAIWVRNESYEVVRDRVNKPRGDGGFGLDISIRPLQTFRDHVERLAMINQILKNRSNPQLTVAEFEAISGGEKSDVSDEVHGAILDATRHMVLDGDNKPTDLLALQRLADFPARADLRDHKKGMDDHRKYIADRRLALSERAANFREEQAKLRAAERAEKAANSADSSSSNSKFKLWNKEDIAKNQAKIEAAFRADPILRHIGLPPGTQVDDQGNPIPGTADSDSSPTLSQALSSTLSNVQTPSETNNPEPITDNRASTLNHPCESEPSVVKTPSPTPSSLASLASVENVSASVESAAPSALSSLEQRVSEYTLARHFEALHGQDRRKVGLYPAQNFKTKMLWCPCGHKTLPCPEHGHFPEFFWRTSPDSSDYCATLLNKGMDYTAPHLMLAEQKKREQQEAAIKRGMRVDPAAVIAHAIARWRSNTPRPRGVPFPDDTWNQQCPCGNEHKCDLHPDLYSEVRYMKPWNVDYIAALKRENILVYTPTKEEIEFWKQPEPSSSTSSPTLSSTLSDLASQERTSLLGTKLEAALDHGSDKERSKWGNKLVAELGAQTQTLSSSSVPSEIKTSLDENSALK